MHTEFAPIAFISAFVVLVPLPWHWRAGNVATLSIIAWLFVTNMIYAVDAVIWAGNVDIVATVWCDISTKLIVGANFALPAACLCISIHLEQVSSVRVARTTLSDKRHRQFFEALMCFGLPMLFMGLHYVVQGHRFDIIEDYGCRPNQYFSIASIFIIYIPPIVLAIGAVVFAGLALRHFMQRRASFATHLSNKSALTTSRYLRLMLMSTLEIVTSISVTSYSLYFTVSSIPIRPWTTWEDVHFNFSRVDQYPSLFIPKFILRSYCALWWTVPVSTWLFIVFFAFGHDAMEEYKKCFAWIRVRIFRQTSVSKQSFFMLPTIRTAHTTPGQSVTGEFSKESTSSSLAPLSSYMESVSSMPQKFPLTVEVSDYESTIDLSHYGPASSKPSVSELATPTTATETPIHTPPTSPPRARVTLNSFATRPVTYPSTDVRSFYPIKLTNAVR